MLSLLVGGAMLLSLPWAFPWLGATDVVETRGIRGILGGASISLLLGLALTWLSRGEAGSVLHKEALAVVGLGWMLAGVLGALPYLFAGVQVAPGQTMTVIDALFESISGFTTTGASLLPELEDPERIPKSIMFWRCFTQWLGGMGIIVLFIALLGHLGMGGKALMHREVTGPINESVMPRVRETALFMWQIYVGLSALLLVIFLLEGMTLYDASCHTFATIATGGFSTHNASVAYFNSPLIEGTMILFMIISSTNFTLFYVMLFGQHLQRVRKQASWWTTLTRDSEWRTFMVVLGLSIIILGCNLILTQQYETWLGCIRHASFMTVSIMTSTGFGTEDFSEWSEFARALLLLLMFIGGCAGSTAGGMKVIRFLLFFQIIRLEIEKAYRPKVVRSLRLGGENVPERLRHEVVVYFSLTLFLFVSSWMVLNTIEPDSQWQVYQQERKAEKLLDCASAVAATLNNIGPGFGVLGPSSNFSGFSQPGKLLLSLLMLLGRLELFAVLVLFFPSFWRNQ